MNWYDDLYIPQPKDLQPIEFPEASMWERIIAHWGWVIPSAVTLLLIWGVLTEGANVGAEGCIKRDGVPLRQVDGGIVCFDKGALLK